MPLLGLGSAWPHLGRGMGPGWQKPPLARPPPQDGQTEMHVHAHTPTHTHTKTRIVLIVKLTREGSAGQGCATRART